MRIHLKCLPLVLMGIVMGCSSAPRGEVSPQWPATWDGRKAFATEHAVVYARNDAAVEEIERMAADVAREFSKKTGGQPTRGLIIVTDIEDAQIAALPLEPIQPSTLIPEEIRGLPVERREMVLASPIELTREQVTGPLGFSPESTASAEWTIALPSRKRLEKTANQCLDSTLAKPELGAMEKALITGFKPMFAACIADTVGGTREAILYKQFCDTQRGWDDARKTREFEAFSPPPAPSNGQIP